MLIGYYHGSIFGGALTAIFAMLLASHLTTQFLLVVQQHEYKQSSTWQFYKEDSPDLEFYADEFENSFNYVFGVQNYETDFDILNNPYFDVIGYDFNSGDGNEAVLDEKYELTKNCSKIMQRFIPKQVLRFYP